MTIADHVADKFMATPTAAAECLSTPSKDDLLERLEGLKLKLHNQIESKLNQYQQRVDLTQSSLKHPQQRIENYQGQFSHCHRQLENLVQKTIDRRLSRLQLIHQQLLHQSPATTVHLHIQNLNTATQRLQFYVSELIHKSHRHVQVLSDQLNTLNPRNTLKRGYSILRLKDDESILSNVDHASLGDNVTAELAKGSLELEVRSVKP